MYTSDVLYYISVIILTNHQLYNHRPLLTYVGVIFFNNIYFSQTKNVHLKYDEKFDTYTSKETSKNYEYYLP